MAIIDRKSKTKYTTIDKEKLEEENIKCGIFYNDEVKDQFE